jgi:putative tricarboxylic transport membrane protein
MKKILPLILISILCVFSLSACGQKGEYPYRDIELVIPASPGGGSDIMGRLLVEIIQNKKLCPRTITPVNKAGGGGSAGQAYVNAKTDPDHTIFTINDAHTIAANVSGTRPEGNFTPIAMLAADEVLFVTGGNSPYTTMDEAIEAIKANPLGLTVGCADQLDKICVYDINNSYGVQFNNTYFDSAGEIATAIMGGHVEFGMFNPSECASLVEAGELRALAVFATERMGPPFKDVPTFTEMGHSDLVFAMTRGIMGHADMSREAQLFWSNVFKEVCESDEWKAYLESGGLTASYMDCDAYTKYYEENEKNLIENAKALGDI